VYVGTAGSTSDSPTVPNSGPRSGCYALRGTNRLGLSTIASTPYDWFACTPTGWCADGPAKIRSAPNAVALHASREKLRPSPRDRAGHAPRSVLARATLALASAPATCRRPDPMESEEVCMPRSSRDERVLRVRSRPADRAVVRLCLLPACATHSPKTCLRRALAALLSLPKVRRGRYRVRLRWRINRQRPQSMRSRSPSRPLERHGPNPEIPAPARCLPRWPPAERGPRRAGRLPPGMRAAWCFGTGSTSAWGEPAH